MNRRISEDKAPSSAVGFLSLSDFFFSNADIAGLFSPDFVSHVDLPHCLETSLAKEAELCRKLLMLSCEINSEVLRAKIKGQDPSSLALYRGFSRFLLDDLALHPNTQGLTKSQRKKLSAVVAFEMIKVNLDLFEPSIGLRY